MGKLSCKRCGATAEADSQEEADELIDHARGVMIGRPCSGKQSDLVWETPGTATPATTIAAEVVTETPKSSTKTKKSKKG